jgi:hypothetical protein
MAADQSIPTTRGGAYATLFAGTATEACAYTGAGRLCKLITITAGTSVVSVYDGTQSTGGTLVYTSITNDVSGTVKELDIPIVTGITLKGATNTGGFLVTYNKTGSLGN